MNNKLIYFIIFLFSIGVQSQTQSGEIIYKVKPSENNNNHLDSLKSKNPQGYQLLKERQEKKTRLMPFLAFQMDFNTEASRFTREESMENDNKMNLKGASAAVRGTGVYYTNVKKGLRLRQMEDLGEWLIEKSLDSLNWDIKNETKEIKGYTCKKATATVNLNDIKKGEITAWFAPDLPFQFGPVGYGGLSGLILGLEVQHYYFYADKIKLSDKSIEIKQPAKGKRVTQEEFGEEYDKLVKKRFNQ